MVALAALLPVAGAALGGIEGYKRSGGDLGATALGAGMGAVGGGGLRMAGAKLAGLALGTPLAKAAATKAVKGMALSQADKLALLGAGALGTGGATLGLPLVGNIAGGASSALAGAAPGVAQGAVGLGAYPRPGEVQYGGGAVPPVGRYGGVEPEGSPLDVAGLPGMGRRLETVKSAEAQRDALRLLLPEIYQASEARSKSEFERQMAAAGIRQNIATRAAMLQQAQQAGLGMGLTAAQQAGGALTSQYQYQ